MNAASPQRSRSNVRITLPQCDFVHVEESGIREIDKLGHSPTTRLISAAQLYQHKAPPITTEGSRQTVPITTSKMT
jgi:hypothetical protein